MRSGDHDTGRDKVARQMGDPVRFCGAVMYVTVLMVLLACGVMYVLTRCGW